MDINERVSSFLGKDTKKQVKTRKFAGEVYTFYVNSMVSWVTGKVVYYLSCDTPKNGFGYSDCVIQNEGGPSCTMYRYLAPWKLRKIEKEFEKIQQEFSHGY